MVGSGRSRWFAAGVAAALVCGGAIRSDVGASVGSGERTVYVPITPCRLFDTRPGADNVGGRSAPLGPGETFTIQARGPQGQCNLPADASGLSLNVAVIGGTAGSFLTVFPAGTALPLAANLNWVAGQPPTPNKVDAGLSADGRVSFYNYAGNVDVAADVNGYYVDHTHDDRYYTKAETYTRAEVDARLAGKADADDVARVLTGRVAVTADALHSWNTSADYYTAGGGLYVDAGSPSPTNCFQTQVHLPNGATVTGFSGGVNDSGASYVRLWLFRQEVPGTGSANLAILDSVGTPGLTTLTASSITNPVVSGAYTYVARACLPQGPASYYVRNMVIDYTIP